MLNAKPGEIPPRNGGFRQRIWYPAVEQAGLPTACASTTSGTPAPASSSPAPNPKAVQTHLGHSSITVTMDRYTHLVSSDIDDLIRRLDDIRARTPAAQPRPNDRARGIELGGR